MRFHTPPGLHVGTACETHGYGASTQLFAGEDSAVMAIYERLAEPTRERTRYTIADQDALVDRWGHLPLIPNSWFGYSESRYGGYEEEEDPKEQSAPVRLTISFYA